MVSEAIGAVTETITGLLTSLGTNIVNVFDTLILTAEGKLTTFATYTFIFIGIGFCSWLFRKVCRKA